MGRLSRYFHDYHESSVARFSALDMKILHVRSKIEDLLFSNEFGEVEGILMGLMYSDRRFASQVVLWPSKWHQNQESLLQSILQGSKEDPPLSLLQLVVDLAPSVITQPNISKSLPLHSAIRIPDMYSKGSGLSLDVVRFLIEADANKTSLTARAVFTPLEQSVFREDESIARLLLSYPEIRKQLTKSQCPGPLYYASRDWMKPDSPDYEPVHPWVCFWLFEVAKVLGDTTPCCTASALDVCRDRVDDEALIRRHCPACACDT